MLTFFGRRSHHYNSRFNPWVYFCVKISKQDTYVWGQAPFDWDALASGLKPLLSCLFHTMVVLLFLGDDAREAVKHGLDGILVSNHGGRQLDGVPATVSFGKCLNWYSHFYPTFGYLYDCLSLCIYFCVNTQGKICMNIGKSSDFKFSGK